jgi:DNA-binding NarL/FixJ family response regulator
MSNTTFFSDSLKIVTVDDSPVIAARLQALLSDMSKVKFMGNARNSSAAHQLVSNQKPDVVILDIHLEDDMPNANGINLLVSLRRKYPDLKIIMLTNLTGPQYQNTCMALGADYFLDKSNDFDKIYEVLEALSR